MEVQEIEKTVVSLRSVYLRKRLERFIQHLEAKGFTNTPAGFDAVNDAVTQAAESLNIAECNRCGEFKSINDLEIYREDEINYTEYVCTSCFR